jgi:anti-anti-sigma regulatory factor/HAMP domain-containing protein
MLAIMLLIIITAGIAAEQIARQAVLAENELHVQESAAAIAAEIESKLAQVASFPLTLSALAATLPPTGEERLAWYDATIPAMFNAAPSELLSLTTFFEPDFIENRLYAKVWYLRNSAGEVVPITVNMPGEPGYDPEQPVYEYYAQEWYTAPLAANGLVWSEPYFDAGGADVNMVTASVPVYYEGELAGVSTADVQLETITVVIDAIRPTPESYAILISSTGLFIASPRQPEFILNKTLEQFALDFESEEYTELAAAMREGQTNYRYIFDPINQGRSVVAYHPIASTGWSVAVFTPEADLLEPVNQLRRSLLGVGVLALVALAVVSWFGASTVIRPLQVLLGGVERFATDRSALQLGLKSDDEIGRLGRAFEQMSAQVANSYGDLEQQVAKRTEELQLALRQQQQQAAELASALDKVQQRDQEISALSLPIVPLSRDTLVVPLVGLLDPERANQMAHRLLHAVESQRAKVVIIDVTGLALVDKQIVQRLIAAAHSVRLLGAEVIVVGIRPEMAEAMVGVGVTLDGMRTLSNLQAAVGEVLRRN